MSNGVHNDGLIIADGGQITVSASSAGNVLDNVINLEGVVQANAVSQSGGVITIHGGDYGKVRIAEKVRATGYASGKKGGKNKKPR